MQSYDLEALAREHGVIGFWKVGSDYGFMSQWAHSNFSHEDHEFDTAEQFMMWSKAMLFNDEKTAEKILKAKTPREQKNLGREVRGFNQGTWDKNKLKIVEEGTYLKFSQNLDLKTKLLNTGSAVLVEASPEDKIWGVGLRPEDQDIKDPKLWKGENLLGIALMKVRELLR